MRECGCEDRGRHQRTCSRHIERKEKEAIPLEKEYPQGASVDELYNIGYGRPPHLSWYPNKPRQKTVERRIEKLVRRYRSFYLTTMSVDGDLEEEETWYIDGGNWASKTGSNGYNKVVGHIKNCLVFLGGMKPKWKVRRRQ